MKRCGTCKEEKDFESFYNFKHSKDGKANRCKQCDDEARRKYRSKNLDAQKVAERERSLKSRYGISIAEYDALYKKQGGRCAICTGTDTKGKESFSVDHCHSTGKVRGLLCNNCNRALGLFTDDVFTLYSAIDYLKANKV